MAVFHSNLYFWKIIQQQTSLQKISDATVQEIIIQSYKLIVQNYLAHRDLIPESQRIEVHYEDIAKDPIHVLTKVYDILKLGSFPKKEIKAFQMKNPTYKPQRYSSTGIDERLKKEWSFAFEQWSG